jgi:hypothetical protein
MATRIRKNRFAGSCCVRRNPAPTTAGVSGCGVRSNRPLHPDEYAMEKKDAKVVAKKFGINKQEAESQIVAEIFRNLDHRTSNASGGVQDYEVHAIIGCQSLNCDGYKTDPQYANHDCNRHYIAGNQQAYDDLVNNNPVSTAIAGTGMVGYSLLHAVSNHGMKHP